MNILQNTFFINLEERCDRLENIKNEFKKMNIESYERINAVKLKNGAIGCTLSHIRCLEIAKIRDFDYIFICEDDICFTNPELLKQNIDKFIKSGINWDVLLIGGNNAPPYKPITDFCIRIYNCQTTTGYVVKKTYYDKLITNFKNGVKNLMNEPTNKNQYAIDMYWKRLQQTDNWYMIIPPTVTQIESFSNVEDRMVNYSHLMLDIEKKWLFGNYFK